MKCEKTDCGSNVNGFCQKERNPKDCAALSGKSQTTQKLEILGGRRVTGEQLERLRSAVDAGQTAALEAMERRLSREKPNEKDQGRTAPKKKHGN